MMGNSKNQTPSVSDQNLKSSCQKKNGPFFNLKRHLYIRGVCYGVAAGL